MPVIPKPISLLVGIPNLADRLERHSMPEPMSGCWIWVGALISGTKSQRPALRITHGKWDSCKWNAVRVAYFAAFGLFDDNLQVCHHCDNGLCVNPQHLFLGTSIDNNRDRHRKGRTVLPTLPGEEHFAAKLTDSAVREIRNLIHAGMVQREIARRFNVNQATISSVKRGLTWRHVI